jgi:hypothetical protein
VEAYSPTGWARLADSFDPVSTTVTSLAPEPVTTTCEDAYLPMLEDFVAACHGEPSSGATAAEALLSVDAVQTARARGRYLEDLP